jgi:hypothetical protein
MRDGPDSSGGFVYGRVREVKEGEGAPLSGQWFSFKGASRLSLGPELNEYPRQPPLLVWPLVRQLPSHPWRCCPASAACAPAAPSPVYVLPASLTPWQRPARGTAGPFHHGRALTRHALI